MGLYQSDILNLKGTIAHRNQSSIPVPGRSLSYRHDGCSFEPIVLHPLFGPGEPKAALVLAPALLLLLPPVLLPVLLLAVQP